MIKTERSLPVPPIQTNTEYDKTNKIVKSGKTSVKKCKVFLKRSVFASDKLTAASFKSMKKLMLFFHL